MEWLSKRLVISVAAVMLFAGSASAVPVCTNDTNLHQYICSDSFGPTLSDFSLSVPLPRFDASLGTLTRIDHFASALVRGDFMITNNDPEPGDFDLTARSTTRMRYGGITGTALVTVVPLYTGSVPVGGGKTVVTSKTGDASGTGTFYEGASLTDTIRSQYVGSGYVPFYITVKTASGVLGSGDYDFSAAITTNGIAKVIYTYAATEIPEPATMLLIGSSLLLIGFRRKSKVVSA